MLTIFLWNTPEGNSHSFKRHEGTQRGRINARRWSHYLQGLTRGALSFPGLGSMVQNQVIKSQCGNAGIK